MCQLDVPIDIYYSHAMDIHALLTKVTEFTSSSKANECNAGIDRLYKSC